MKRINRLLPAFLLLLVSGQAAATTVNYSVSHDGFGGQYEYSITNDTLGFEIFELTIHFDYEIFASLSNPGVPVGWDPLVVDPVEFVNDDGFYDVLALGAGIAPGETLGGFTIDFVLLGGQIPGAQRFEVLNPLTFAAIEEGLTELSPIPVPAALWLFASGIFGLLAFTRRKAAV